MQLTLTFLVLALFLTEPFSPDSTLFSVTLAYTDDMVHQAPGVKSCEQQAAKCEVAVVVSPQVDLSSLPVDCDLLGASIPSQKGRKRVD